MSEPLPPSPPLPPDDQELEEFLAGRSELSQRYREDAAGVRAPTTFDAAILAAAEQAVAAPPSKPRPRLQRWRLPLSLAATLVVGIGVLREVPEGGRLLPQMNEQSAAMPARSSAPAEQVQERSREAEPPSRPEAKSHAGPEARAEAGSGPSKQERAPEPAAPEQGGAKSLSRKPVAANAGSAADRASAAAPVAVVPAAPAASAGAIAELGGAADARAYASPPAAKAAMSPALQDMAAPRPSALPQSAIGWQAARYRGLLLGEASLAEVVDRLELPSSTFLPASQVLRLEIADLQLPGVAELRFTAEGKLQQVQLTLDAPMPLAAVVASVMATEALFTIIDAVPDHCAGLAGHLLDADRYPQRRLYRAAGVVLRLSEAGTVTALDYLSGCH